jgi:hypothetical protein
MARPRCGYLKLYRLPEDHDLENDPRAMFVWVKLLMWATYEPENICGTTYPAGTVVTSIDELSRKTLYSKKVIRGALDRLSKGTRVELLKGTRGTVVTICNWDKYQSILNSEGTPEGTPEGTQRAHQGNSKGNSLRIKESKNQIKNSLSREWSWEDSDPFKEVFENLKGFDKYWAIFDREKDRKVIQEHMTLKRLSINDMIEVTRELRFWADGPNGAKVKSPRGTLATFVRNFVERKSKTFDINQKHLQVLPPVSRPQRKVL